MCFVECFVETGSTVCFVVFGPVVAAVRNTAEIVGTFGNWGPFGAIVGNLRNQMYFVECKFGHKVVVD